MAYTKLSLVEAPTDGIHAAFRDEQLTSRALGEACLARIATYDSLLNSAIYGQSGG